MFTRLSREGQAPRAGGRFQSRADFVAQEEASRKENQLLRERESILGRIRAGISAARNLEDPEIDTRTRIRLDTENKLSDLRDAEIRQRQKLSEANTELRDNVAKRQAEEEAALRRELEGAKQIRDELLRKEKVQLRIDKQEIDSQFKIDNAKLVRSSKTTAAARQEEKDKAILELARLNTIRLKTLKDQADASAAFQNEIKKNYNILDREALKSLERRHAAERAEMADTARTQLALFAEGEKKKHIIVREEADKRRENIPAEIEEARRTRFDFPGLTGGLERGAARTTAGLGDFVRGLRGARQGLSDFSGAALRAQGAMTRFGADVGRATRNIGSFVNIRWLFLISIIQVFLTLIIQVGAALVAIASSAVMAGAALGGALAAGAAQALPVIGLLAAAMNKLEGAMKVVELRSRARDTAGLDAAAQAKTQQSAVDGLADAQYNLKQAIEAVSDANEGIADAHERVTEAVKDQKDAIIALADARKEAARAIVDASLDERDANLSLREAELGVLDAKERLLEFQRQQQRSTVDLEQAQAEVQEAQERLRVARAQGDQAEISTAVQQLSIAQQNVSAIKDQAAEAQQNEAQLQTSIERANLNVEQARVRQTRAAEENRRRQQQGVEGSPEVGSAKEQIVNAEERHADAVDSVKDAENRKADALHNVAIAQRNVARAQTGVTEASDKQSAAARNAEREFDKLSKGQQELVKSIEALQEAWNSPEITGILDIILLSISRGIRRILILLKDPEILGAFRYLSTQVAIIVDRFSKWTISPEGRSTILFFIREAALHLPIIARAAGNFGLALIAIAKSASPIFTRLLERLAGWGEDIKGVTDDTERLDSFFASAGEHLDGWLDLLGAIGGFLAVLTGQAAGEGLSMVENLTRAFQGWTKYLQDNPEAAPKFFKRIHDSIKELLPLIGEFIADLIVAFSSEEFQAFTRFVIEVFLPALLNVITFLGYMARAFEFLTELPIVGEFIKFAFQLLIVAASLKRLFGFLLIFRGGLMLIIRAVILVVGVIVTAFGVTIGAAILAAIAILVLLILKWDAVKKAVRIAVEFIIEKVKEVLGWFRRNWKDALLGMILAPFTITAAFADKIKSFGKAIIQFLIDGVKSMGNKLWDAIKDKLGPLGKIPGLFKKGTGLLGDALSAAGGLFGGGDDNSIVIPESKAVGGTVRGVEGQPVPIIAHAGEWILNKSQQMKLATRVKQPVDELKMWLFGTAGKKPGGQDGAAPVGTRGATKPAGKPVLGPGFKLHPHTDTHGVEVWFVELADGKWGQVTKRAAERIAESGGAWMPGYVRRANAFATGSRVLPNFDVSTLRHFAGGGEVQYAAPGVGSFAAGGTTIQSGSSKRSSVKTLNQKLEINTASPTVDIDYVMRVAGMHAEASF